MRLAALSTYIPARRVSAEDVVLAAGGSRTEARVFSRMLGLESVSVSDSGMPLRDRFAIVLDGLAARLAGDPPDTLIYVHGQPLQPQSDGLPAVLRRTHPFLAGVVRTYEIDQNNCAGGFWALQAARQLLSSGAARSVAILTGDSHLELPLGERYVPGCTLLGDGFAGLVVDGESSGYQIGSITLHHYPKFNFGLYGTPEQMRLFFSAHSRIVKSSLDASGFSWARSEALLPHNINRLSWQLFCRETDLDMGRVDLGLLPDIGHCYTSDPFLLLSDAIEAPGRSLSAATLLSVGMGAYVGACRVTAPVLSMAA